MAAPHRPHAGADPTPSTGVASPGGAVLRLVVTSRTVTGDRVRLTYRYGGERGVAICHVAEDRDDRGPLPYVHATACDIEDEALLDELEAAALAAWERHAASSSTAPNEEWFVSHGEYRPHRARRASSVTQPMAPVSMDDLATIAWAELAGKVGAR